MSLLDQMEATDHTATDFTPVPEGEYVCQVTDAEMKEELDELLINIDMVIHSGEYTGRKLWYSKKVKPTHKPAYLGMIKGDIYRAAGIETSNGQTLPQVLKSTIGNYVNVVVSYSPNPNKPGKNYTNTEIVSSSTIPF